jgi:hypothetical protein
MLKNLAWYLAKAIDRTPFKGLAHDKLQARTRKSQSRDVT